MGAETQLRQSLIYRYELPGQGTLKIPEEPRGIVRLLVSDS